MPKRQRNNGGGGGSFKRPRRARGRFATTRKASFRRNARTGGFLGIETKFFDTETTDDAFAVTWAPMEPATTNLTAIAQGDGESNRDGRKYSIKSIHLKGWVHTNTAEAQTAPQSDHMVRIVLVLDKQTNGAQLTATQVFDGGQTEDTLAFRNLQFTKRFTILFDRFIRIPNSQGDMAQGGVDLFANALLRVPFKYNKVFTTPIEVLMSGTTADIANVTDNSIHMIGVSTHTTSLLSYQCRVRFVG